jgi:hypothetical protein
MNVEIGTETPIFLFWEYLFQNFGILSLQCVYNLNTAEVYLKQSCIVFKIRENCIAWNFTLVCTNLQNFSTVST